MTLSVICPSSMRADRVFAARAIRLDAVCVPESQVEAYRRCNPQLEIVAHPDDVVGLPAKRQWIYDRWGDVFMVDDDVAAFMRLYRPTYKRGNRFSPDEARAIVEATYRTAIEMGAYLFSLAPHGDARLSTPQKPFRLTGFVNGAAFGLRAGSKLWFPRDVVAVSDTAISGLNAHFHRFLFMDERYGFRQHKTFRNPGGLAMQRTADTEFRDTATLKRMFGDAIGEKTFRRRMGANEHAPAGRALRVPF